MAGAARGVRQLSVNVRYHQDHSAPAPRAAHGRPHPRRGRGRSPDAPSHRLASRRRTLPPRGRDRVAVIVTLTESLGFAVSESHGSDPHSGPDDRGADADDRGTDADDLDAGHRRSDRNAVDASADDNCPDTAADQHASADADPLGPSQLRNDRRELAHGVARYRDVADTEALSALEEELAQRRA